MKPNQGMPFNLYSLAKNEGAVTYNFVTLHKSVLWDWRQIKDFLLLCHSGISRYDFVNVMEQKIGEKWGSVAR
jgi:hypothetical protein